MKRKSEKSTWYFKAARYDTMYSELRRLFHLANLSRPVCQATYSAFPDVPHCSMARIWWITERLIGENYYAVHFPGITHKLQMAPAFVLEITEKLSVIDFPIMVDAVSSKAWFYIECNHRLVFFLFHIERLHSKYSMRSSQQPYLLCFDERLF